MTRRSGAGRWSPVLAALVLATTVLGVVALGPSVAGACSMASMDVDFDGTVTAVDGDVVTYRVDRVRGDGAGDTGGEAIVPEPGQTTRVRYDGRAALLAPGTAYRVKGWAHGGGPEVGSQIAYDFHGDCGTGAGTSALDGSLLGAEGADQTARSALPYVLVAALVGVVIVVVHPRATHRADRPIAP